MVSCWVYRSFFLIVICLLSLSACTQKTPGYPLLGGETVSLSDQAGKVVFINYWAEWCAPCREEIPELNKLYHENPDRILVLGVNFDNVPEDVLTAQANAMGIEFPQLLVNPMPELGVKASGALPETLVLNGQGQYLKTLLGPQTEEKLLQIASSVNGESRS